MVLCRLDLCKHFPWRTGNTTKKDNVLLLKASRDLIWKIKLET
jgi:hypothetical protein